MKSGILSHSIAEIRSIDDLSRQITPVHTLDSRTKLILVFAFVVSVMSFPRYAVLPLIPFFSFPLWLAAAGRIPFRALVWKLVILLPLAVMAGFLNPVLDTLPKTVAPFGSIAGGWVSLFSILLRFFLNAGTGLLLIGTTGAVSIAQAFSALRFPRIFGILFLLIYRYLFVLTDEFIRLNRARQCRSAKRAGLTHILAGPFIGTVLLRSWDRAERITAAMRLRGYAGTLSLSKPLAWTGRDTKVLVVWLLLFAVFRLANVPLLLGQIFEGFGR